MTDTPNLALRRRVAERAGWTELELVAEILFGYAPGERPETHLKRSTPLWELSMDACLRDLVPRAKWRGYPAWELADGINGSYARFSGADTLQEYRRGAPPATAFCRAWLELPGKEG